MASGDMFFGNGVVLDEHGHLLGVIDRGTVKFNGDGVSDSSLLFLSEETEKLFGGVKTFEVAGITMRPMAHLRIMLRQKERIAIMEEAEYICRQVDAHRRAMEYHAAHTKGVSDE